MKERLGAGYRSGGWRSGIGGTGKCEASALKERFLFLSYFCFCAEASIFCRILCHSPRLLAQLPARRGFTNLYHHSHHK